MRYYPYARPESEALFEDRTDAGKQLAESLNDLKQEEGLILALPRGGVPVGYYVADYLDWPMSVVVTRKLGAPYNPEFGFGAVSELGVAVFDEEVVNQLRLTPDQVAKVLDMEERELERRIEMYHVNEIPADLNKKTIVVVDDGLATGITARAGCRAVKERYNSRKLVFAAPVCAGDSACLLEQDVDEVRCLSKPRTFMAVGNNYQTFDQVSDEEVLDYLKKARVAD